MLDTLKFGAKVEVKIGYGDHAALPTMITGHHHRDHDGLRRRQHARTAGRGLRQSVPNDARQARRRAGPRPSDSDVVSQLAKEYNLATDIETTKEQHAQVEQNQESDFEFVKKLAARNHFEFYVGTDGKLRFGPPRDRDGGDRDAAVGPEPAQLQA